MNADNSQTQQPQCLISETLPFELNGKLVQGIVAKHSDGFTCLRLVGVDEPLAPNETPTDGGARNA